jgi:crotonobetainyl-CoA:carnitine CoA-transferase CaiB-like acyl-CoA transferase
MANRAALTAELSKILVKRRTGEWLGALESAGIICAPVATYDEVAASPQLAGILSTMSHQSAGEIILPGFAIGGRAAPVRLPPPTLGEHDREFAQMLEEHKARRR